MARPKAATMFSGIGAPEFAAPHWDWRWCAEIDRFTSAVHAAHFGTPNIGDVTAPSFIERAKEFGPIDALVFGSPCQSFSVQGERLGLDDPRGHLALVALNVARQLRPRWLVFENVPGLLSSDSGRDFGIFLRIMEQCGYYGAWRILDAQFAGVPQRRRRLFFVGYLGDWRPPAAVLFEPESLRGDTPPRRGYGEGATPTASAEPASGDGIGSAAEIDLGLVPICVNIRGREGGAMPEVDDIASVRAASGGSSRSYIAFSAKDHGADAGELSPTLRSGAYSKSHANGGVMPAISGASGVRRLTPLECERLMGFPDDFTMIEYRGRPAADSARYTALGNSMAVPVIGWILGRIEAAQSALS